MNLGLGNLAELKAQLLGDSLSAETAYDPMIEAIGKGVAALFDRACNRKFERVENDTYVCSADRAHVFVPRYPLESVATIEERGDYQQGWTALRNVIQQVGDGGFIYFASTLGDHVAQIRITYTGGYWFDTTEDSSGVQPAGSALLPADVTLAWYLQCKDVWEKCEKFGGDVLAARKVTVVTQMLGNLDMSPAVRRMLQSYIRYSIT